MPLIVADCTSGARSVPAASSAAAAAQTRTIDAQSFYQPLALHDSWRYQCRDIKHEGENNNQPFVIKNAVIGETTLGKTPVYKFSLQVPQVPSKPLKIDTIVQLLANDSSGNVRIYGYLIGGKVVRIPATVFVTAHPPREQHKSFDYRGPDGKTITRIFYGLEQSNPTKYGVFEVAPYFESSNTHDYGYAKAWGIVEEDHGPNYEVDCLLNGITRH